MANDQLPQVLTDLWDSLTDEQKAGAKACTTVAELMQYAGEQGVELPDEVLDGVAGGYTFYDQVSRTYEIINDSTGDVMDTGYVYLDNAQTNARYQGQKPDLLNWDQLNALRNANKGGGC